MARKAVGVLIVLLWIAAMTTAPSAHHSRAMFDIEKLISVEGVVAQVQWRYPHMWIEVDVPGPNGKTERWGFEGAGAAMMVASGISPEVLKVGSKVKFIGHPAKDTSKRTAEFQGMEVNGRFYSRGTTSNIRGTAQK
jgi:hypothetical protein